MDLGRRLDVVVQMKDVVRVVAGFDAGQARVVLRAEAGDEPILTLVADEVEVDGAAGPGLEVGATELEPPYRVIIHNDDVTNHI